MVLHGLWYPQKALGTDHLFPKIPHPTSSLTCGPSETGARPPAKCKHHKVL